MKIIGATPACSPLAGLRLLGEKANGVWNKDSILSLYYCQGGAACHLCPQLTRQRHTTSKTEINHLRAPEIKSVLATTPLDAPARVPRNGTVANTDLPNTDLACLALAAKSVLATGWPGGLRCLAARWSAVRPDPRLDAWLPGRPWVLPGGTPAGAAGCAFARMRTKIIYLCNFELNR